MSMAKTTTGFVSLSDGAKVFYEHAQSDSADTLLCLPGAFCSGRMCFSNEIDVLSKDFNIVALDPRGFGKSKETKREFSPMVFHQDANDAAELMRQLGYKRFTVLGISDGGVAGIILAAKYPNCVKNLIIFAANAFVSKEEIEMIQMMTLNDEFRDQFAPLFKMYGEERCEHMMQEYRKNFQVIYDKSDGDICISEVKAVICPTLIMQGDQDNNVAKCHPQFLHNNISNSSLYIIPHGDHYWPRDYPEEFHRVLKDFLNGKFNAAPNK